MPTTTIYNQISSYTEFVENLANNGDDELFFNSGPTHAAIVMSRIFKYSKDDVRIFCGGFTGAVSNDEDYLKYLEKFLQSGGNLKILVQQDLSKGPNKIFKILRKYSKNVEIYLAPFNVVDGDKGVPLHFTIGDERMLRIETGIEDYTAQVNFGNSLEAKKYIDCFDILLNKSKDKPVNLA